jgi:hypothetical protein
MPVDHLASRQNALNAAGPVEVNDRLEAVAAAFGPDWIAIVDSHPLQRLWARRDFQATNELAMLGDALMRIGVANAGWLAGIVKKIKTGDPNNRRGALFELHGLNLLCAPNQAVRPAPRGNRGFDGTIDFAEGLSLQLSIKSYGDSAHERSVIQEAEAVETVLIDTLQSLRATGASVFITATQHPLPSDWVTLRRKLPQAFTNTKGKPYSVMRIGELWQLVTHGIPAQFLPISSTRLSHQMLLLAPYHANERDNLLSKLAEARVNFVKHAGQRSDTVARGVLVRLPETASLTHCKTWCDDYFRENPAGPIDAIFLYQPAVTTLLPDNQDAIVHHFGIASIPRFNAWQHRLGRPIAIRAFVGLISPTPPRTIIQMGGQELSVDGYYMTQRGRIFTEIPFDPLDANALPATASIANPAPGITISAVFKDPQGNELCLDGIFSPEKKLAL